MEIKHLNKGDLRTFIESDEFQTMDAVPISYRRAISQINNPRADENDILLILVYHESRMTGYLGLLPDLISTKNGAKKIYWMSCIWVRPEMRGSKIAFTLVNEANKTTSNHLILTNFTDSAKRIYLKAGYLNPMTSKEGIRCYFRLNLAELLPAKDTKYRKYTFLLKLFDFSTNIFLGLYHLLIRKIMVRHNLNVSELQNLLPEDHDFIDNNNRGNIFKRNTTELNWIKQHPWLHETSLSEPAEKRYIFSSGVNRFRNHILTINNSDNEKAAILFLSIRDNAMKIPYAFFGEEHTDEIIKVILSYVFSYKICTLTIFNEKLSKSMKEHRNPFLKIRTMNQEYMCGSEILESINSSEISIADGDGDAVFT